MNKLILLAALAATLFATTDATAPTAASITANDLRAGIAPTELGFSVQAQTEVDFSSADKTVTFVASKSILANAANWDNSAITTTGLTGSGCTVAAASSTGSVAGDTIVFTLTDGGSDDCKIAAAGTALFKIATNIAVNPAAGAVTATAVTAADTDTVAATVYTTVTPSTFTVKTISSSSSVAGATNTISVGLKTDNAALAANDVIKITMGANKFNTNDKADLTIAGTDAAKFGSEADWVKATGVLTLTVAAGQSVTADTAIAITFDLTNVDAVQAALTPAVAGTAIAAAGGTAIASSAMAVTGMNVATTFTVKTISSSSSVAGATNTISVGLKIDNAALAAADAITITMGANKFTTADAATLTVAGTDAAKFGSAADWVKATGVLTLTVANSQTVAADTAIAITFDLTNVAVAQAALTPAVAGNVAAAAGDAIASSNMVVTGMNVVATAANPSFTPAAGNVAKDTALTLASADSTTICFRSDGTAPTCKSDGTCNTGSTAYNATAGKPTVTATSQWKAIGCAGTSGTDSAVSAANYTVNVTTTTAAPAAATTTVSGASSEAAWSTMLTVFAIAMAAFSTL